MISNITCRVVSIRPAASNSFYLSLQAPAIARLVYPGQFVYIKPSGLREPILRRAFSVMDADKASGSICLYIDVKGPGTIALSKLDKNDEIQVLGPLGSGFKPEYYKKENILIGGGCGSAPLYFLAKILKKRGKHVEFYYGARSKTMLPLAGRIKEVCDQLIVVTDDGSMGRKGLVTSHLSLSPSQAIFSCGPKPMLKAVSAIAPDAHIAMETEMACGVGVCMGCAVLMKDGTYKRCCTEGPVFRAGDVQWD